jgi:hypothetical protein
VQHSHAMRIESCYQDDAAALSALSIEQSQSMAKRRTYLQVAIDRIMADVRAKWANSNGKSGPVSMEELEKAALRDPKLMRALLKK